MSIEEIKEPIYFESCLTSSAGPAQTLYNCRCMLSMLNMKNLSGCERPEEAAVGFGLVMYQVEKALDDIAECYDFVEKSNSVSALG